METREEVYYFDKNDQPCGPDDAVRMVVRELDQNGELVNETTLFRS